MNVAVLKTKTEQALSEAFGAAVPELPGTPAIGKLRRDAMGRFGSLGPSRRGSTPTCATS